MNITIVRESELPNVSSATVYLSDLFIVSKKDGGFLLLKDRDLDETISMSFEEVCKLISGRLKEQTETGENNNE